MARKASKRSHSDQFELIFDPPSGSSDVLTVEEEITVEPPTAVLFDEPALAVSTEAVKIPPIVEAVADAETTPTRPEIVGPCIIYTDGGCEPNPGRGGWAAIIIGANGIEVELSGTVEDSTNNRMEIWAALQALENIPPGLSATVHTDSQYLQKGATEWLKGWKRKGWVNSAKQPVANKDLWQLVDAAISTRKVTWKWVRGHADNDYNNRCDVLANAAAKKKPKKQAPALDQASAS